LFEVMPSARGILALDRRLRLPLGRPPQEERIERPARVGRSNTLRIRDLLSSRIHAHGGRHLGAQKGPEPRPKDYRALLDRGDAELVRSEASEAEHDRLRTEVERMRADQDGIGGCASAISTRFNPGASSQAKRRETSS
ncbi:hypothetical protein, partial [Rhodovulum sulfidophilum]|uniref:hypothetical protein n=1 Tax=Rhodovulum sulfidophilum TaxID=35806 RepID=UPI001F1C830F